MSGPDQVVVSDDLARLSQRSDVLPQTERKVILPPSFGARLAVELGARQGWDRYDGAPGDMLGIERFGASAPSEVLLQEYDFSVDNVCTRAKALPARALQTHQGPHQGVESMTTKFKVGDHVRWNSEAGYVSGRIIKVHTHDTEYKGHPRHCTDADPQYEIKSDRTEHIAMHKGAALRRI